MAMEPYANAGGKSNVIGYDLDPESIRTSFGHDAVAGKAIAVMFADSSIYLYTAESCGAGQVFTMTQLARGGFGLNGYINRYVKKKYARKL